MLRMGKDARQKIFACAAFAVALTIVPAMAQIPAVRQGLEVENLDEPVETRTPSGIAFVRDKANGHVHLLACLEAFNGTEVPPDPPFQVYDLNLDTGEARLVDGVVGRAWVWFPHSNGKLYMGTSRPPVLMEYDPDIGAVRNLGRMSENYYHSAQTMAETPDGRLFVGNYGLDLVVYDPAKDEMENLGNVSEGRFNTGYIYYMGADENYVYCNLMGYGASGQALYDWAERKMIYFTAEEWANGVKTGEWMRDGKQFAFPEGKAPRQVRMRYAGDYDKVWPLTKAEELGFEIDVYDMRPTKWNGGLIVVRWRKVGEENWRESRTAGVNTRPATVAALTPLPDGRLIGVGAFYGPTFSFDPKAAKSEYLGPSLCSVSDIVVTGNKVCFSGYATAFAVYDLEKPWTFSPRNELTSPDQNPRIYNIGGKYNYHMAVAADGKVYIAGFHERHDTGASLHAYDPVGENFIDIPGDYKAHQPNDLVSASGGSRIVMSWGPNLVVVDAATQKVERIIEAPGVARAGNIMDAGGDLLFGLEKAQDADADGNAFEVGRLYLVNLATGEFIYRKTVPGRFFTGYMEQDLLHGKRRFTKGPDGWGWLFVDEHLCRIDPSDGTVERIMPVRDRGRMFFIGNDLYIYNGGRMFYGGFAGIHRISNVLAE